MAWGEKDLSGLHFTMRFIIEGKQGRNLEAGADAEGMGGLLLTNNEEQKPYGWKCSTLKQADSLSVPQSNKAPN